MGAKNTSSMLPFCHPLPLEYIDIEIKVDTTKIRTLKIDCVVKTTHKTGVEMEALVGATQSALCVYDMLKAMSHDIVISDIRLISKSGGKSDYKDKNTDINTDINVDKHETNNEKIETFSNEKSKGRMISKDVIPTHF